MKAAVYFDFDGTLAHWNTNATLDDLYVPGYYASLAPEKNIVSACKRFMRKNDIEVYGLTCTLNDQCRRDKLAWRDKWIPGLKVIAVPDSDREHKFDYIPTKTGCINILVDDHTPNLFAFEKAGGYGVKCMNDINGRQGRWQGCCIFTDDQYAVFELDKAVRNIEDRVCLKEKIAELEEDKSLDLSGRDM